MTADSQRIPIKLLLGIGFGMFLGVLSANSIPVMIGSLLDGLAITEAEVGVLGTVELLAVAIAALAAAPLARKVSNSRLAVFGCLLAVAAQFLSAAVDSLYLLAGMRAIAGAGLGLAYAAAAMAAAATANPDRVLGYGVTAGLLAIVIFLPCLAMVVTATGYKGAYVALGLLVIVLIPVMRWLGRGKTIAAESGKAPALPVRSLVGLLLCITFFNIGSGAIWSFSERVGLQAGFSVEESGFIIASGAISLTFAFGPARGGFIATWFSYAAIGWFSCALCLLAALAFILVKPADTMPQHIG